MLWLVRSNAARHDLAARHFLSQRWASSHARCPAGILADTDSTTDTYSTTDLYYSSLTRFVRVRRKQLIAWLRAPGILVAPWLLRCTLLSVRAGLSWRRCATLAGRFTWCRSTRCSTGRIIASWLL